MQWRNTFFQCYYTDKHYYIIITHVYIITLLLQRLAILLPPNTHMVVCVWGGYVKVLWNNGSAAAKVGRTPPHSPSTPTLSMCMPFHICGIARYISPTVSLVTFSRNGTLSPGYSLELAGVLTLQRRRAGVRAVDGIKTVSV